MKHSLPTEAGQINDAHRRDQLIDAINQVFALFRLNFHAQFFKAFATESELMQIKKLWLAELIGFDPQTILRAGKSILETSDYLPTLHTMIRHCEMHSNAVELPDPHSAYLEACRAPSPKSRYKWSHPVVYFAGKACDWYFLHSSGENIAYPVFRKKYSHLCEQVKAGQKLTLEPESAIEQADQAPLAKSENLARLAKLKKALDF